MTNARWWLIADETVSELREMLEQAHGNAQTSHEAEFWTRALHTLDSGLHVTEAVPDDFRTE